MYGKASESVEYYKATEHSNHGLNHRYEKFAKIAIILVYNHVPALEAINCILKNVNKLIIIDNASSIEVREIVKHICSTHKNCLFVQNEDNLGISRAINNAVRLAESLNAHFIFFFDHDVFISDFLFEEYAQAWRQLSVSFNRLGIVVPIVTDDKKLFDRSIFSRNKYSHVDSPINSGIMTTVEVFKEVGGYNESIFTELADFDFTSKVKGKNYKIMRINRVLILQTFENKLLKVNGLTVLLDNLIRVRSIIRVGICNSNIFRTKLSVYTNKRWNELDFTTRMLSKKSLRNRIVLGVVRALNNIERLLTNLFLSK